MFAVRVFSFAIARQFSTQSRLTQRRAAKTRSHPESRRWRGISLSRFTAHFIFGNRLPNARSLALLGMTCYTMPGTLNARTPATAVARVSHRSPFRFDLRQPSATLHFHDLIAQQCGPLEFQIDRGALHLVFEFAKQLGQIEIAPGFINDR